jgi:phage shock protein A
MAKPNVSGAENAVRDLKNWIAVFAQEYDLAEEAVEQLHEQIDKVAAKIAEIK